MTQYMTTIKELGLFIKDILDTDRDAVIVCTGDTGEGKSTALWLLARSTSTLMNVPFNPVINLIFDRNELNTLIDTIEEYSFLDVDEAVGLFYAREYHDEQQIALLKKLDRIRYRHLIIAFAIPSLWSIDSHIRNARVRLWLHVDTRKGKGKDGYAHAYIFKKEKNPFNSDPWNMAENRKLFGKGRIDKSPNYMGEVIFHDMPNREANIYRRVKDLKRKKTEAKEWKKAARKHRGETLDPAVTT